MTVAEGISEGLNHFDSTVGAKILANPEDTSLLKSMCKKTGVVVPETLTPQTISSLLEEINQKADEIAAGKQLIQQKRISYAILSLYDDLPEATKQKIPEILKIPAVREAFAREGLEYPDSITSQTLTRFVEEGVKKWMQDEPSLQRVCTVVAPHFESLLDRPSAEQESEASATSTVDQKAKQEEAPKVDQKAEGHDEPK
jgi:hypothetical protein